MRYALILLSLCLLSHSAPALANVGAVLQCDEELSNEAIKRIILNGSPLDRGPANKNKVADLCIKLYDHRKLGLTQKQKQEIIKWLVPDINWISHDYFRGYDTVMIERFRAVFKVILDDYIGCLNRICYGQPFDFTKKVAEIVIVY